ncbi:MAG TPA: hypothetical protein PLP34_05550 [Chitinophagaceae bacterium]|nr:hypothetical protein [Chitinophagaceae bacterium]HNF71855.1 hypothetical protein [Chitinophagaceae bacterium]
MSSSVRPRQLPIAFSFVLFLIVYHAGIPAAEAGSKRTLLIRGQVTQTSEYCGGAMPTPEVLKSLETPQPLPDKVLYLKTGSINKSGTPVYRKIVCDSAGRFSVRIPEGRAYCIIEDWKAAPMRYPEDTEWIIWDKACFRKRYESPDFLIPKNFSRGQMININFHQPCFFHPWCGTYSGPLPP